MERRLISPRLAIDTAATTKVRYRRERRQGETHRLLLCCTIDVSIHFPHNHRPFLRCETEVSLVPRVEGQSSKLQFMRALITDDLLQGPKEREDSKLDVRTTYYILQKSHHLYLYANPKAQPSKRIAKFDMLKPEQRQAFVEIRRLTAEKYPPTHTSSPPKHKDVTRVQRLYNSRRERQIAKKLAQGKSDALRE